MSHPLRLEALRAGMARANIDAFFSVFPPDCRYLSGFSGDSAGIVVTRSHSLVLCDARFTEQAQAEVIGSDEREIRGNLLTRLGELLAEQGCQSVGFDPSQLTVAQQTDLLKAFPGTLLPTPDLVSSLRVVKSSDEIEKIRASSNIAEAALADVLEGLRPGVTEQEVAARLEFEFRMRGASGPSFDTIVLFGPRSSLPHGQPGATPLQPGDVVLIDIGCRRDGYCSDLTRTFAYDTIPDTWFDEIYSVVLEAQLAALDAVGPGVRCSELDAVARTIIADAGFGKYFGHGLGHGVGLEVHEAPRVNSESSVQLTEGMVITIEPGIYLPGQGGVRIEDLVVVTADGCDVLTRSSKQLRIL